LSAYLKCIASGPPTHAFGIAFRHAAPKSYYFFGIDGRGRFTSTTVVNDVSHTVIPFTPKARSSLSW
jgi:hypothetical protein